MSKLAFVSISALTLFNPIFAHFSFILCLINFSILGNNRYFLFLFRTISALYVLIIFLITGGSLELFVSIRVNASRIYPLPLLIGEILFYIDTIVILILVSYVLQWCSLMTKLNSFEIWGCKFCSH